MLKAAQIAKTVIKKSAMPLAVLSLGKGIISSVQKFKRPDGVYGSESRPVLKYDSHVPTTTLQKATIFCASSVLAIAEPTTGEYLAAVGDISSIPFLRKLSDRMKMDKEGRQILKERPNVWFTDSEFEGLGKLPKDTFGYHYYTYMNNNKITFKTRTPVKFVDDEELAYVMLRHRHIHDFYHTLLGMDISLLQELAVKYFEFIQTGLPVGLFATMFAPVRLDAHEKEEFYTLYLPWIRSVAENSKLLLNVYWEKHWDTPIDQLRKDLGVFLLDQRA